MRLKAHDTMHISSVKADSIRPGEEFETSDAAGEDLLKAHPDKFTRLDDAKAAGEAKAKPDAKAEPNPKNKAEEAPPNKADTAPISAKRK
jgi:hypothetical protein